MTYNFVKVTIFFFPWNLIARDAQSFAIGQHGSFAWALAVHLKNSMISCI